MKKPNIVVFCTDQQPSDWLGCAGNPILKTPNLDALAADGMLFTNAFCNTPICMASRATMFTGLPGSVTGCRTNGIPLDSQYPALPQILKEHGYQTMSTGKLHLTCWSTQEMHGENCPSLSPEEHLECAGLWQSGDITHVSDGYFGLDQIDFIGLHGWASHGDYRNWLRDYHPDQFEKFINRDTAQPSLDYDDKMTGTYYSTMEDKYYYNEWIKDCAIKKIDQVPEEQPFFSWISFPDPHWPYGPAEPYSSMYDPKDVPPPVAWDDDKATMPDFFHKEWYAERKIPAHDGQDTSRSYEQVMESKALSYGMMTAVDVSIGQVIDHLKATGRYEDTIIIFVSDHGDARGDHKMFNKGPFHYDPILRIPFIVRYPNMTQRGVKSDAFVQLLDFMPTVLDLAGVAYPAPPLPDWQGFNPEGYPLYDTNSLSRLVGHSLVPVMTGEKEAVQDYVLIEDDDDLSRIMVRTLINDDYKLIIFMNRDDGVLFDRKNDPEERRNVWDAPEYAQAKADMMVNMSQALLNNQYRGRRRITVA